MAGSSYQLQLQFPDGKAFSATAHPRQTVGQLIQTSLPELSAQGYVSKTKYLHNLSVRVFFADEEVQFESSLESLGVADGAHLIVEETKQGFVTDLGYKKKQSFSGVLYHIGTRGGAQQYRNPGNLIGGVVPTVSSAHCCLSEDNHAEGIARQFVSAEAPNNQHFYGTGCCDCCCPWMAVDLGENRELTLERFEVRNGAANAQGGCMCCWEMQGSNDGQGWEELHSECCNWPGMSAQYESDSFKLEKPSAPYQNFRIQSLHCCWTGCMVKRGGCAQHQCSAFLGPATLLCAGVELYGELRESHIQE
eukprot:TRINITY_DN55659_c0_g1_i1.p1 TRINITY_DN55659_c0_g1~~TRINITY_DN55659_c0_g1_i1.p1  ORF type:complete len:306 (+),score=41.33 TRINITY_DN55659_c0_g1_i1:159-1076(+)